MDKLIIVGTSRKDADTNIIIKGLIRISGWDMIDLNDYDISYYDYDHENKDDDYLVLIKTIIEKYEVMVFATPVY